MFRSFDASRSKGKPQQNVQVQNSVTRERIRKEALWHRSHVTYPDSIRRFFEGSGIHPEKDILVDYDEPVPNLEEQENYEGVWVTIERQFISFEIKLGTTLEIESVVRWQDVTELLDISAHKRGTGKTYWWLCLEVLGELNASLTDFSMD